MKDFQNVIGKYLLNREKNKKYLALLLALCLLVSFAVPYSLIQPADSLTIDRSHLATQLSTATPGTPSKLEGTNMLDITSADNWSASMMSGNTEIYVAYVDESGNVITTNSGFTTVTDPINIEVAIDYQFKGNVKEFLAAAGNGPHLGWYMGNNALDNQTFVGQLYDEEYNDAKGHNLEAGTYIIEGGYVKITLTKDYLDFVNSGDGSLKGSLSFDGTLSRNATDDGDQHFTMAGETVIIAFPDKNATIESKNAYVNTSNGTVEWTVTINNANKVDMKDYVLTDDMLKDATNVTFNPPGTGTHATGANTISFTETAKDAPWITIKYTTPITKDQMNKVEGSATNTAKLTKGDQNFGEKSATADFNREPIYVNKTGTPDYNSGTYAGKINWSVTVTNNYGLPLTEYIIEDPKLTANATVSDGSELTPLGDNKWMINSTASSVTINYTTDAVEGTNENTAQAYYPGGTKPEQGGKSEQNVTYKTESELFGLNKTHTTNTDGTITWNLIVNNQNRLNMENYTLTDKMLEKAIEDSFEITNVWVNGTPTPVAKFENGKIVFTSASKEEQWLRISYKTPITEEMLKGEDLADRKNDAQLNNPSDKKVQDASDTAKFEKGDNFTVTKTGTPDYQSGAYGGKINWTVRITSTYGTSLDGYLLEDAKIPDTGWTVSPSGTIAKNGDKWELSGTNGAKTVTITYEADATAGDNNNTATLYYPDGGSTGNGGTFTGNVEYKSQNDLIGLDKSGWYSQDSHEMNWQIMIKTEGGADIPSGYYIEDKMLANALDGSISFNPSDVANKVTRNGNRITFNEAYGNNVTITYRTLVNIADGDTQITPSNTVGDGMGHKDTWNDQTYEVRNTLNKNSTQGYSYRITNNGQIEKIVNWNASIVWDGSFSTNDKFYEDILTVTSGDGTHTITAAQLAAITITARKDQYGGSTTLVAGTDFTAVKTDTGFKITFAPTVDEKGYNYVDINYSTTLTANAPTGTAYPYTYTFGNTAKFNGKESTPTDYTITRDNPVKNIDMEVTIRKDWQNDTDNERPANVVTKVLYKTNEDGTWRYLKTADGKPVYYGDEAYASASDYTVTLDSAGAWTSKVTGLRKETATADENGNPTPTVYYYYMIEEITPSGKTIVNGLYEMDDGYYQVSYTNNQGINYNGTISVTNKFYRDRSVTPKKYWTGNTGTGTGIDSVTVQLEYSIGEYENNKLVRYPVKIQNGTYVFDANGTTAGAEVATQDIVAGDGSWTGTAWTGLPSVIVVDNQVREVTYHIAETAVTQTAAEGGTATVIPVLNGSTFVTSDGYYRVSNSVGDGYLTVTNEFVKTVTYSVGVQKAWADDVNHPDSRPEVILVQLQRSKDWGEWTSIGDPVELSTANNWAAAFNDLPNQLAATDGTVENYRYRVIEVGYKMTAGGSEIMFPENTNSFATDENGVYNISYSNSVNPYSGNSELSQAGTVTVKNTFVPVTTIDLTPQKMWKGDKNEDGQITDRPQSITFTLQQSEDYGTTWKNVIENEQPKTVTLTSDTNSVDGVAYENNAELNTTLWSAATIYGLPSEKIVRNEDGTYTKKILYYRFLETSYVPAGGGNSVTLSSTATEFKTENGKYKIDVPKINYTSTLTNTNTYELSIGIIKTIVDDDGNKLSTIEQSNLAEFKRTIDGVDYYVFNWIIEFESDKTDLFRPLVDDLPEGFTLCTLSGGDTGGGNLGEWNSPGNQYTVLSNNYSQYGGDSTTGYFKHPTMIWCWDDEVVGSPTYGEIITQGACPANKSADIPTMWTKTGNYYYYDTSNGLNRVIFNKPSSSEAFFVGYATKIECSKLDELVSEGTYSITNNAEKYESDGTPTGETSTATLKIVNPIDTNLITKSYNETKIPGNIQYSLNINPEGKNLSSGDTIDIQDLFETVSYFDHDYNGGDLTNGKKLVDVLMSNIKIYEVDANGNKIELNSSDYTLMFQSGADVSNGAALMKLTIPDETHIVVDYTYKLIANETTPSVIHGCKSSTRVNGRYATMAPGMVPPAGDKITFSNTAKLSSDSAESSDSKTNTEYEVFKSTGTISTNALPSIKKVNTGDYSIDNLSASFLLARYENGKWYYVDQADVINEAKGEYDITWGTIGAEGTRIAEDAERIEIVGGSNFKVALDENMLYKLVEIEVPEDYEGSNLGLDDTQFEEMIRAYLNDGATIYQEKDYTIFLNHYISTHYFTYNSTVGSYPAEVKASDVVQVKSGSNVEIPNNKLIDIGVTKTWVNPVADVTDSEITVELYWSFTKNTTGIPEDAEPARAEDLGILDENFSATKTIKVGDAANDKVWTNLPNGSAKKPIYYYIKETAYTIGGKTYFYDSDSNSFKAESGEGGAYMPTYTGNAANDDTIIDVRNSYQLMLKKEWKNAANDPMKNIPVDGVVVSIYGIYEVDGVNVQTENPLFEGVVLSSANNWTADLTSQLSKAGDLSLYKAFVAVENENPAMEGYVVSCVFNLNAQTGEIIVTNKNTLPTEASVSVNKLWSDGNTLHANESIEVVLYQSQTQLSDLTDLASKITLMGLSPMQDEDGTEYKATLNAENEWTHSWTGLPLEDDEQNKYYYYVLENMSGVANASKYNATYVVTDKTTTKTEYTVKNTREAIVAEKQWLAEDGSALTVDELKAMGIDSIKLEVVKKVATVPEDGLDIVALGDSITRGEYQGYVAAANTYPPQLEALLEGNTYGYSNVTVIKQGQDTTQIPNFESRLGDINSDTEIVCIIGGTNDIHQDNSTRPITEIRDRMSSLIGKIKDKNSDIIILVGSIPHFDFVHNNTNTDGAQWWGGYYNNNSSMTTLQAFEDTCNARIDAYNVLLDSLAASLDNVYYVDICAAVDKDTMLYVKSNGQGDGCHPNEKGYKAIASTFATAINSLYSQSASVTEFTLTADNNWMAAIDIEDADPNAEYYIEESDIPAGWTVTYSGAPQKIGSSTPIVVTNTKHTPKTDLTVEKIWQNDEEDMSLRGNMTFTLLRSIDNVNWEEVDVTTPTRVGADDASTWTFKYEDLPAEDSFGNTYYYMVEEDPLTGYVVSYGEQPVPAVPDGDSGTLQMTNTFRPISLNVEKFWSIPEGLTGIETPDSIQVQLQQSTDGGKNWEDVTDRTLVLSKAEGWTGLFADIPGRSGTIYRVREVTDLSSYGWFEDESKRTTASEDGATLTLTNTLKTGSLEVEKDWIDGDDDTDLPEQIMVAVYRKIIRSKQQPLNSISSASAQRAQAIRGIVPAAGSEVKSKAVQQLVISSSTNSDLYNAILNGSDMSDALEGMIISKIVFTVNGSSNAISLNGTNVKNGGDYASAGVTFEDNVYTMTAQDGQFLATYGGGVSNDSISTIKYDKWNSDLISVVIHYELLVPPLTLAPEKSTLKIGETVDLELEGAGADSTITWTATFANGNDASSVVGISNKSKTGATITALQAGTVIITASDGTNTATSEITVNPMQFTSAITMFAGDKLTLAANNFENLPANYSTIDYECSAVDANGYLNNVTETTEYTLTAIAKDADGNEITRASTTLTVSPFEISPTTVQLSEGTPVTLTASKKATWVLQEGFGDYVTLTPSSDGTSCTVTYKKYTDADFTVTAMNNTVSAIATIDMQTGTLVFGSKDGYDKVHVGGTIKLKVTDGAEITGYDADLVTFNEDTLEVTGKAVGQTLFTATRNGAVETLEITVIDELAITGDTHTINTGDTLTLNASNAIGILQWTSDRESIARVNGNGVVTGVLNGDVTITATDVDGTTATYTIKVNLTAANAGLPEDKEFVKNLTLNAAGGWKNGLDDLPLTDGMGNVYEYYIVELDDHGNPIEGGSMTSITGSNTSVGYIPVSYLNNGTELTENESAVITVSNKKLEHETQGSMPSAGGSGTTGYYGIGVIMILGSAAGYLLLRRRQKDESK
ncbi:MAG: Cna B-type domain-containing protein [Oscillospiraceae bacterium]|nr:Cna B-type domain-containing protein [Oscillospiraceae bacterium]